MTQEDQTNQQQQTEETPPTGTSPPITQAEIEAQIGHTEKGAGSWTTETLHEHLQNRRRAGNS